MKTSAILCAVLAGTFGFTSVASARDWRGDEGGHDRQQRAERRFEQRHDARADRRGSHDFRRGHEGYVQGPRPVLQQPRAFYNPPVHRVQSQRFHRGGYLPHQYRSHAYYVNDWRAYPALYAPPYGQQWVNVDGEFLLVALASGLIFNALLN